MSDDAESTFSGNKKHQIHFLVKLWLLSTKVLGVNHDQSTFITLSEFSGEVLQPVFFLAGRESCYCEKSVERSGGKDRRKLCVFPPVRHNQLHSCGRGPFQLESPPRYSWQGLPDALSNYRRMRTFFVLSDHNHWQLSLVLLVSESVYIFWKFVKELSCPAVPLGG